MQKHEIVGRLSLNTLGVILLLASSFSSSSANLAFFFFAGVARGRLMVVGVVGGFSCAAVELGFGLGIRRDLPLNFFHLCFRPDNKPFLGLYYSSKLGIIQYPVVSFHKVGLTCQVATGLGVGAGWPH